MNILIPNSTLREYIIDIILKRSSVLDELAIANSQEDLNEIGYILPNSSEIGWMACGTRALADDIKDNTISLSEAIKLLSKEELKELQTRCLTWQQEQTNNHKR